MTMDIGFSVVESLKAVESWINNINTNMVGAAKTGYKANRISFGGSNAQVQTLPGNGLLPTQQAEPSMRIASTAIDFTQGQVVASSQATHFALKDRPGIAGTNFFVVREARDRSGNAAPAAETPANFDYFLTRDGEFHWAPATVTREGVDFTGTGTYVLVNNYNLVVMDRMGKPLQSATGNFASPPTDNDKPLAVNVKTPQNLVYSRYGSTIFNNNFTLVTGTAGNNHFQNATPPTAASPEDVSQDNTTAANITVDRVQSSLESSNASVTTLIPELTLAQKMFTALSKVLTVFNENLDITFGLIR